MTYFKTPKQLFLILLMLAAPKPALAQHVYIRPANVHIQNETRGSSTAMCWIDFDAQGIFTSNPWCQVHLPRRGRQTNREYLKIGESVTIHDRTPGQPGTAVCTVNFDRQSRLTTVPDCHRGYGGSG